jgi:hypothetical protein
VVTWLKDEGNVWRRGIGANDHLLELASRPILLWRGYARSRDIIQCRYAGASVPEAGRDPSEVRKLSDSRTRDDSGMSSRPFARVRAEARYARFPAYLVRFAHRANGPRAFLL